MLEAVGALFLSVLAMGLNIELVRRAQLEVLLQYGSFIFVRDRALGAPHRIARKRFFRLIDIALGKRVTKVMARRLHTEVLWPRERILESKFHIRYPAFIQWPGKHHFEITHKCRFSFSH